MGLHISNLSVDCDSSNVRICLIVLLHLHMYNGFIEHVFLRCTFQCSDIYFHIMPYRECLAAIRNTILSRNIKFINKNVSNNSSRVRHTKMDLKYHSAIPVSTLNNILYRTDFSWSNCSKNILNDICICLMYWKMSPVQKRCILFNRAKNCAQ